MPDVEVPTKPSEYPSAYAKMMWEKAKAWGREFWQPLPGITGEPSDEQLTAKGLTRQDYDLWKEEHPEQPYHPVFEEEIIQGAADILPIKKVMPQKAIDAVLGTVPEFLKRGSDQPEILTPKQLEKVREISNIKPIDSKEVKVASRQLQYFPGSDEFKKSMVKHLYENDPVWVDRQRRGVRGWTTTENAALKLAVDNLQMERLAAKKPGAAFNAEELLALQFRSVDAMAHWRKAQDLYKTDPNNPLLAAQLFVDFNNAMKWTGRYWAGSTEIGRAQNIQKRAAPQMIHLKDVMRYAGGTEKILEWSDDMIRAVQMIDFNNMDEVMAFMNKVPPPKASNWDKIFFAVQNGWLSGPKTHFRNIVGNTAFILTKVPETAVAGAIDSLASLKTKRRTVYSSEGLGQVVGFMAGVKQSIPRVLQDFKKTLTLEPLEAAVTKVEEARFPIKGKRGEFVGTPMKLLQLEDEMAKAWIGSMEIWSLSMNHAFQKGYRGKTFWQEAAKFRANPPSWATRMIEGEKLYRTFQKDLGRWGKDLMQFRNQVPGIRYILPFVRTPINIFKAAGERSPFGALAMGRKWQKGVYEGPLGQRTMALDASRTLLGSAVATYIASEFVSGNITGPPPKNAATRSLYEMYGMQPYSIRTQDGSYVPIGEVIQEPWSLLIEGTIGTIARLMENDEELSEEEAWRIAAGYISNIADRSFLRGLSDFAGAMAQETKGGRYLQTIPTWFVPYSGALASLAQTVDPFYRQATTPKERIMSRLPFLSEKLPARRGVLGEPRRRPGSPIERGLAPFGVTKSTQDIVPRELMRMYQTHGHILSFPGDEWVQTLEMSPMEYQRFLEEQGEAIHRFLGHMFRSSAYQALPDELKWKETIGEAKRVRDRVKRAQIAQYKLRAKGIDRDTQGLLLKRMLR
jgi:hypothetical protein